MFDQPDGEESEGECCFCGDSADSPVELAARWLQDGQEKLDVWFCHRSCLMQALGEQTRKAGGPLYQL